MVAEEEEERSERGKPRPSLSISLCNYHLMFFGDLETSVSRRPFFPPPPPPRWRGNVSPSEINLNSLFIIVYLAPEQSSKWSRPRPQASGSAGPQRWLAVCATAKSKDQSLLHYMQSASCPRASFHV